MCKMKTGIFLIIALSGCSSPSDEAQESTEKKQQHVWQEQVETLDKARAVEQTLIDAQKRRDAELRRQEE